MKQYIVDQECWKNFYLVPQTTIKTNFSNEKVMIKNFIPTSIEEAPVGYAPSVPKEFLVEEKDFCHRKKYKVIAYVHSAIKNVEKRQTTRNTWASSSEHLGTVFMVGKAKNEDEQKIVESESARFHDIVQGNYTDLYRLLTYKALNSMYWLKKNCGHIQWVIHADDDVLIDVFLFFKKIKELEKIHRPTEIICITFNRAVTNRLGKWEISRSEFPCTTYPLYCSGPFWFSPMKVINQLYKNIQNVKYVWVDDAYITGLLAEISNVKRTHIALGIHAFSKMELGKYVAWNNVITNRTDNWQSIISYHSHLGDGIE